MRLLIAALCFIVSLNVAQAKQLTDLYQAVVPAGQSQSVWQQQALARAPAIAALDHGPVGVFMGYDFHLTDRGPRLIEINSNELILSEPMNSSLTSTLVNWHIYKHQ